MSLLLQFPSGFENERAYIAQVLLNEWLGLQFRSEACPDGDWRITTGKDGAVLHLPDVFFKHARGRWLCEGTLPPQPLKRLDLRGGGFKGIAVGDELPVIFGDGREPLKIEATATAIRLPVDVFGSAFFMLTRYEEVVKPERDAHDRFPASASLAYQEGFLERPIVDEYTELLWACIKRLWPSLERKGHGYRVFLSHDVDHPLGAVARPWPRVLRAAAADVVRRRSPPLAARRLMARTSPEAVGEQLDPNNCFDFVMDVSERYNIASSFYFKADATDRQFDEPYRLESAYIQALMRRISERGHRLGLHPSYHTYLDAEQTHRECRALLHAVERAGIQQDEWGGRQHYLRWRAPVTWLNWELAGLSYDSTLSYADRVGFRCGTSREYNVFDITSHRGLHLRERPLVVMECTITLPAYMNLPHDKLLGIASDLSVVCRRYAAPFSLLWHNTELITARAKALYQDVVHAVA